MPAGPENTNSGQLVATRWPDGSSWHDYPSFRKHIIEACLRTKSPVPDDRTLASEYEHRVVELTRLRAVAEIWRFNEQRGGEGR